MLLAARPVLRAADVQKDLDDALHRRHKLELAKGT